MIQADRIKTCKTCINHEFDSDKGIVCGLTKEKPTFETSCADYKANDKGEFETKRMIAAALDEAESSKVASHNTKSSKDSNSKKTKKKGNPKRSVRAGAHWFYWIAGLSFINSIGLIFDWNVGFIAGLGITQIFDAFLYELLGEYSLWSLTPTIMFSGGFVLIGYLAKKRSRVAFIIGMILYALDSLLFLMVTDMFGFLFHMFALYMIYNGFKHLKTLREEEETVDQEYLDSLASQQDFISPIEKEKENDLP